LDISLFGLPPMRDVERLREAARKALADEPERTALLHIAGIQRAIGLAEEQQIAIRLGRTWR
jgi:hypothetical protein